MVNAGRGYQLLSSVACACAVWCSLAAACSSTDNAKIGDGELSVDRNALATYAGSWDGYVEAFSFTSGSDHLRSVDSLRPRSP